MRDPLPPAHSYLWLPQTVRIDQLILCIQGLLRVQRNHRFRLLQAV